MAKLQGALPIDTIKHVTFNSPVFLPSTGSSEAALSGAVAKTAKGQFAQGVKGNSGVYAFQVIDEKKSDAKLADSVKETTKTQITSQALRAASRYIQELYQKANIKDNRYIFY